MVFGTYKNEKEAERNLQRLKKTYNGEGSYRIGRTVYIRKKPRRQTNPYQNLFGR